MKVHFWGTRGSLPFALNSKATRAKVRRAVAAAAGQRFADDAALDAFLDGLGFPVTGSYGGNSSCVQIDSGHDEYIVCDAGSGLREFGLMALGKGGPQKKNVFNIFLSHVHWDHIMGFPFFVPAYIPGNVIRIHGCHAVLEQALRKQQGEPCFPVDFSALGAAIEFVRLEPGKTYDIAGTTVRAAAQYHAGDSYGYRFERAGRSVVYSTDSEYKLESAEQTRDCVAFFQGADLVIFDAMYSLAEAISVKEDWGHSSNIVGVELCHMAAVKHYCMFHHEPAYDDDMIHKVLLETIRYEEISRPEGEPALQVSSAYDGLEIAL